MNKFKSKKMLKVEPSDFITFQSSQKVSQLKSIKDSKVDNFISSEIIEDNQKTKFLLDETTNDITKERANSFGPNQLHKIYPQNSSQETSPYIKKEMYPMFSRRNSSLNLNKKNDKENEDFTNEHSVV